MSGWTGEFSRKENGRDPGFQRRAPLEIPVDYPLTAHIISTVRELGRGRYTSCAVNSHITFDETKAIRNLTDKMREVETEVH